MLQAPLRLLDNFRLSVAPAVVAATGVSTVVFTATPFLIPAVAADQGVDVAVVGIMSTAQLGGFVAASYGAGRWLRPRRRVMVAAIVAGIVANFASAVAPDFTTLAAIRVVSGASMGLIAWIAWAEAFGDVRKRGDVAVVGPIVGTLAAPLVALVIDVSSVDGLFVLLAALHLVPLAFVRGARFEADPPRGGDRHRPTRAAAVILMSLSALTLGGSSVFVYAGAIGERFAGLDPVVVSFAFAVNALASVPSARFAGERRHPGAWLAVTGACAVTLGVVHHPVAFWLALPTWGFSFWMGVPGAFGLLADRSAHPAERAGDAQAVMAAGRVVGPLVGGAAYAVSPELLGLVGGAIIAVGAGLLTWVEHRIHHPRVTLGAPRSA